MNKQEKVKLVKELVKNVQKEVIEDIHHGKVPDKWDGIELRQLLADRFGDCVFKGLLTGARKREYIRDTVDRNL